MGIGINMKITINFNPISAFTKTTASISASTLTLNGESFDLSLLATGDTAQHPAGLTAKRLGASEYELTLQLAHTTDAPEATRFPADIIVKTDKWELVYDYE